MSYTGERRRGAGREPSRRASKILQLAPRTGVDRNHRKQFTITRLLAGLAIPLVVCLAAFPWAAPPAGADNGDPTILVHPASGVPGVLVTVSGTGFAATQWFDIYYEAAYGEWSLINTTRTWTDGSLSITFGIPESSRGWHEIRVTDADEPGAPGPGLAHTQFSVRPMVAITAPPGARGSLGTRVTVRGTGFEVREDRIEILLGGDVVSEEEFEADRYGTWEGTFLVPPTTSGEHDVRARGRYTEARDVNRAVLTVEPGISLDRYDGSPGQSIVMTGNAFASRERQIRIIFHGKELDTEDIRADERGQWQASFEVPELPAGEYLVTADGSLTRREHISDLEFSIKPGLDLSPAEGHVGMNLTITGRGFAPNEDLVILYDEEEMATTRPVKADDKGSFQESFLVPESRHGLHWVTALGEDNQATVRFTMESDPPEEIPEPISPRDGARTGFVGSVTPRLEWSEVYDPSDVYYSLQISASVNVTSSGEFIDPILFIERLVGTSYTLDEAEALSYGTYYWIVRAVDRADNAGNWTAPYSLRAGLLPMWAFIAIIVGAVLLAGGLVYFLVLRQRRYY